MSDGDIFDEDLFDKIKKLFNLKSDQFDMDMFFLPEKFQDESEINDENRKKGFKISYHFEDGMDKPEIKYGGKVDPNRIKELMERAGKGNIKKIDPSKFFGKSQQDPIFDARELTLEEKPSYRDKKSFNVQEPYSEINDNEEDSCEILIEVPGISKDDVVLTISEHGRQLSFSAYNDDRRYFKVFELPFESDLDHCHFKVNNGILTLMACKA